MFREVILMADIIAVGEILVEIMATQTGQGFDAAGSLVGPFASGAPAIFIDQAARMGASCAIMAKVGDDAFGKLNMKRLSDDGVDISGIIVDKRYTTGTAFVTYKQDGSRSFIFHFAESAAGYLTEADINEDMIKRARFLHVMGCSLSAGPRLRNAVIFAVRMAKRHGVGISFDPNIRPELLTDRKVGDIFQEVLENTDILLSGESELMALTGNHDMTETLRSHHIGAIGLIVLKNGKKGIRVISGEDDFFEPPFAVEETDATGAGDCFDGALLACLLDGIPLREAVHVANAAGALSVTKKGPMEGAHFKREIMAFLNARRSPA
jgi:tagatose kinase